MRTLVDFINNERTVDDLQLIKSVVSSYNFIDYALVKTWKDGVIDITLAHPIQGEEVILTNVEVLSHGSNGFSSSFELVEGDIVQLFSSRSFIETIADFIGVGPRVISAYDIATIKAVPVANHGVALNKLTIAADGSYTLEGENYSLEVATDGTITLTTSKDFSIIATGKVNMKSTGDTKIEATGNLILKAPGSAAWKPNSIPNCLYTGAPHGGAPGGIIGLKGD